MFTYLLTENLIFFTMRKVSLMLCLLMMTAGLSGCLGGSDVETSEGDDVVPGELTDDWPTYYVPSANVILQPLVGCIM